MNPEVSCKVGGGIGGGGSDASGKSTYNVDERGDYDYDDDDDGGAARKDWMTNEGTYGPPRRRNVLPRPTRTVEGIAPAEE
jgi:hypothetical protein